MSKRTLKIGSVLCVLVIVLLLGFSRDRKEAHIARAASLNVSPNNCLGGWDSPVNAAGTPSVTDGSASSFTADNSAVLSQKSAQLFCGGFASDDTSFTPTSAHLHFSWRIDFASHADADALTWQQTIASSTEIIHATSSPTSGRSQSAPSSHVAPPPPPPPPAPAPTPSSTPVVVPEPLPPPPAPDASSSAPTSTPPATPFPAPTPAPSSTPVTTPEPTPPPPTPSPAPQPTPAPAGSSTTAVDPWGEFVAFLVPHALAQTSAPSDFFLEVTYTTDGKNWKSIGKVSESNWKNLTLEVPVRSWDEIKNLQIAFTPLVSVDQPTIYFDGMWLEVQHDTTLIGLVKSGASAVADAAQSAVQSMGDLLSAVVDKVAETVTPTPEPTPQVADNTSAPKQNMQTPPPAPKGPEFHFEVNGDIPVATKVMPWARTGEDKEATRDTLSRFPAVATDNATHSFSVTGACSKPYFVVLVFANKDDYVTDPSRAVVNRANPCVNGSYSYQLKSTDLPANLPDGTYYLVIAEEGLRESWRPHAAMYPIVINRQQPTTL